MHTHTCVYTYCMYTCRLSFICIITLTLPLSWTRIHSPFQYTQVPPAPSARLAKKKSSFPSSREIFFKLVINLISKTGAASQKGKWHKFKHANVVRCAIYLPHIFIFDAVMCIEYHRWNKNTFCVLATQLWQLCRDFLNFRSSGSALGLRVHHCVRCNYWKLVPGRPVWYFMHTASGGYLMHSCSGVQHHIRIRIHRNTRFICTKSFAYAHPGLLTAPYVW